MFNIVVTERGLRHVELSNKVKIMRELDTGDLVVVRKHIRSSRTYGVVNKLVFKTKRPCRFLEKSTSSSYCLKRFPFCEGLGTPGRKVKESASRMETIPPTMVLHKHVDGEDTRFTTISRPLVSNTPVKWIGVIRGGTYQASSENIRWVYEPVSNLWPDIEPDSYSIDYGSSDEGRKYQENLEYKEQGEVVSVPCRKPIKLIQGDQRELRLIKSDIEKSKYKLLD